MRLNHRLFAKTLTTVATTVAAVATAAAQAQTPVTLPPQVEMYGLLDVGLVHDRAADGSSVTRISSGVFNGSRWGLRGQRSFDNGLKGLFVIEAGFQADSGAGGQGGLAFGRQAFVGLASDVGTVRLGRQYVVIDEVVGATDPFGAGGAGRNASLVGASYVGGVKGYYTARVNNVISMASPKVRGFSGELAYGFGEVNGNRSAGRYVGAAAGYAEGPLYVRLATQDINDSTGTGGARHTILGARYNFGLFTGFAEWMDTRYRAAHAVTARSRDLLLGASVPVGSRGRVLASWVQKSDRLAAGQDARLLALGYQHDLDRQTTLYTSIGGIHNRNGAGYTVNTAIDVGTGNRSFDVGVRYTF